MKQAGIILCKNCGTEVSAAYCGHCGQKAKFERITLLYICHEVVHFFTHAERGFIFTSRQMLKTPGKAINDFIEGRRKNYQPPVSYYLIWIGIYILAFYFLEKIFGHQTVIGYVDYFGSGESSKYTISHLNIVFTILLPVLALYLFLFLTYSRYNYFENLAAIFFGVGTIALLQILFILIALVFYLLTGSSVNLLVSDILKISYMSWVIISLTNQVTVKAKYLRAVIVIFLMLGTFTVWRLFISPAIMDLFFK